MLVQLAPEVAFVKVAPPALLPDRDCVRSGEVDANGADPVCTRTNIVDHATGGGERGTGMNTGLQEDGIAVGENGVLTGTGYAKQGCGPKEQKNEYVLHLLSC